MINTGNIYCVKCTNSKSIMQLVLQRDYSEESKHLITFVLRNIVFKLLFFQISNIKTKINYYLTRIKRSIGAILERVDSLFL